MLCCFSETKGQDQPEDENAAKDGPELEQGEPAAAAAAACCDSDNATDPTNKHTTRALCAHVASPWPGADGQGVDAGRGDRLPEAAAGAGAGDEPDEQHDDAHGDAAAADVRRHGADGPDGADGPGHDEHGLPRAAGRRRLRGSHAAHHAPLRPRHAALGPRRLRRRRRGRGGGPHAAARGGRRRRRAAGRLLRLPRVPGAAERPGTHADRIHIYVRAAYVQTISKGSRVVADANGSFAAAATERHGGVQQDGGAVPEDEPAAAAAGPAQQFIQAVST